MASSTRTGARSLGNDRKRSGGWIKWLLLALLLIGLAILLIALLSGGDEKKSSASSESSSASASAGTLGAGGTSLLPASARLTSKVGQAATGKGVRVLSTTPSGFFVGTSKTDEVYVEFGGKSGNTEPGSFKPKVGSKVNLTGPVQKVPAGPASALKISAEDAAAVESRGGFINADTVDEVK